MVVEQLGIPEKLARIRGHAFSPGTEDYPPRLLIGFVDGDGTWIVNLKDGSARRADAPGFENDYLQWPTFIGADGKLFSSCGRGGLSVYDPVADTINLVRPIPEARWLRGMAISPDGAVYVSDYPSGSAAKYTPTSGKVTDFGPQGGPFEIKNIYGYSVGFDGKFVYTAAGKMPWYVVALDPESGKQKNILQYAPADHPEIHQRGDRVFLEVKIASPAAVLKFELKDGDAKPADEIPRFDDSYVPGNSHPRPEIQQLDRSLPVIDGKASVRYKLPGESEWRVAELPVSGSDIEITRIAPLASGKLVLATGPYGNVHTFDPASNGFALLSNPAGRNVYDLLETDGTLYFAGYPNGVFGSIANAGTSLLGEWHASVQAKHTKFIVRGADGRIYSGNHNERESTGGALGWFDPQDKTFGGIQFAHDDCEWMTTAKQGKLIVYLSDFTFDPTNPQIKNRDGKVITFDTEARKVIREFSPLRDGSAGVAVETEPGIVLGIGKDNKVPTVYVADVETGETLKKMPLPGPAPRFISRGPDGQVYFFVQENLARIDPASLEVEILCPAKPGRMAFLGNDLYLAGLPHLRRIKNVAGE